LVAAPAGVVSVLVSPIVGRLVGKVDTRWLATLGFLAFAVSFFMRAGLTADASFVAFVLPQLVMGIGMGSFFVAMVTILLDGLPPERVPSASGVSNFLRIVAGAFATSITTTFWDRHEAMHQTRLAESSSAYSPSLQDAVNGLQALGVSNDHTAIGVLSQSLIHQAYLLSSLDFFWISGCLMLAPLVLVWLARRPRGAAHAAAE
jgi:MFS transporter, DHA2 family, multidrug resistance protein